MKKLLLIITIVMVITESFVDCYAAIPRMPQFGLRIPRAPRFLPPFGSSPNLMTQASQMRPLSSSMMMGPNIGPNHHHLGVGGGPMSQPGLFPSPHHMPQNLMPFPGMMKQGPPSIDSMIRSPHHPMSGPIFGQMHNMHHHHPQASHPPPSYHSKPSFYQNKPDDCPFPGCEMEPAYNGEPAVPQQQHSSPFSNNDSPMIPSLTAPDTIGQLDFQSRPPHHQEQFGGSRPSLIMPPQHQQQVKVVYKPVVKLVKIPVEVPVKVKQPYPVKVPVPVQVPFPVKVIQREKIMFPIAVPFNSQVLPVAALVPKSQGINQDQQQQQQQQQIPQQQQQQQQYQPQQPMLKQPQAQSQYHGPGDYQKKLIQVNENGEPYGSQQQQSAIQQNIHPINLDENRFQNHQQQQFYYGNQDHQQQEHYRQQQQGNNQQQQQQYQQQQGNNQQQQQYQQQQGNNQQQQQYRPQQQQQKFRQEIVHVEGPNYRGISDISFGGQQQQQQQQRNNDNNNNNYDNHQQQQQPQGYSGYGYSSMNSDSQSNYNNNNNNDNRGPSTIGQMVQQQQNYNQQQQNWAQSNQQQQKPNFIVPPFDRNFIENYREREQEPEYLMRFLTNTQPQSQQQSSNYGNENNNNVAPYSRNNNNNNPPIYNDNGENSFINIDRGMAGWSPIRLSPSSHQMAESRISHDNHHDNIDDSERESVDSFLQDRIDNDVNEFEYDSSSHIDSIHRPVSIETPYVTGNLIRSPMYMSKFQKRS